MRLIQLVWFFSVLGAGLAVKAAEPPNWWAGALDASKASQDYAVATQGQAMHMAQKAYERLRAEFTPAVVDALEQAQPAGNRIGPVLSAYQAAGNSKVLSLGQLKRVSAPFWLHLQSLEVLGVPPAPVSPFPWTPQTSDDADSSPATLGQVKMAFSFPLDAGLVDSDQDRLPDWWEERWARPNAVALNGSENSPGPGISRDADGDGLGDYDEFLGGSNPRAADTDGDGISDGLEREIGTDLLADTTGLDSDGDGIADAAEGLLKYLAEERVQAAYSSSPVPAALSAIRNLNAHSNSDEPVNGLPDDWEAVWGLTQDSDPDGDGLNNRQEMLYRTWPRRVLHHLMAADRAALLADLNGNQKPDLFEVAYDFAPLDYDDAVSMAENTPAAFNFDGDARSDGDDVREGTDPRHFDPPSLEVAGSGGGGTGTGSALLDPGGLFGAVPPYAGTADAAFFNGSSGGNSAVVSYRGKILKPVSSFSPGEITAESRQRIYYSGFAQQLKPEYQPWLPLDFWSPPPPHSPAAPRFASYLSTSWISPRGELNYSTTNSLLDLRVNGRMPEMTFVRETLRSKTFERAQNARAWETHQYWDRVDTGEFTGMYPLNWVNADAPLLEKAASSGGPFQPKSLEAFTVSGLKWLQIGSIAGGQTFPGFAREVTEGIQTDGTAQPMFCMYPVGVAPDPDEEGNLPSFVNIRFRVSGNAKLYDSSGALIKEDEWREGKNPNSNVIPHAFFFNAVLKGSRARISFDLQYYRIFTSRYKAPTGEETINIPQGQLQIIQGPSVELYAYGAKNRPTGPRTTVRIVEEAGSRFRRIGLDGVPMADGKPQGEAETDQPFGDAHVDALTHNLNMRSQDLGYGVSAGDLSVGVERVLDQEVYSDADLDDAPNIHSEGGYMGRPFGSCWATGLSPHVVLEVMGPGRSSGPDRATVVDETGSPSQFALGWLGGDYTSPSQPVFIPLSAAPDQTALMNRLEINGDSGSNPVLWQLTLHKRFGTRTRYQYLGTLVDSGVQPDGTIEIKRTRYFYRVYAQDPNVPAGETWAVEDRYGNRLFYSFDAAGAGAFPPGKIGMGIQLGLIPSKISEFPGLTPRRFVQITKATATDLPTVPAPGRFISKAAVFGPLDDNLTGEPQLLREVKYTYDVESGGNWTGTRFPSPAAFQLIRLETVSRLAEKGSGPNSPDRYLTTTYSYGQAQEHDAGPGNPGEPATVQRHSWLESILQPDGRYIRFETAYDRSRVFYASNPEGPPGVANLYYQQGRPRTVHAIHAGTVESGGVIANAQSEVTLSRFRLQSDGRKNFAPMVLDDSGSGSGMVANAPVNAVIDGDGRLRVYRFRDPRIRESKTLKDVLFKEIPGSPKRDILVNVAWQELEIDHALGAREIYRFKPEAMMALESSKMIVPGGGNGADRESETRWEYASPFQISHAIPLFEGSALVNHPFFAQFYPDPTAEIRVVRQPAGTTVAVGGAGAQYSGVKDGDVIRKEFKYLADTDQGSGTAKFRRPWARTMVESALRLNGALLRVSRTSLDAQGRRNASENLDANGTVLSRQEYTYHPAFPAFVSTETVKNGVAQGTDLTEQRFPDVLGQMVIAIKGSGTEITRVVSRKDALGQTVATGSGGSGTTISQGDEIFLDRLYYRPDGQLEREVRPVPGADAAFPGPEETATTQYTYESGRLTEKTTADGTKSRYGYDNLGRTESTEILSDHTSEGTPIQFSAKTYRSPTGLVYKEIAPNGLVTETAYDWLRRPSARITRDEDASTGTSSIVRMEYTGSWCGDSLFDGSGFKPTVVWGPFMLDRAIAARSEFAYNSLGWKVAERVQHHRDASTPLAETLTAYNASGQVVALQTPPTQGSASTRLTLTEYDAMGRTVKITSPDGLITQTQYTAAGLPTDVTVTIPASGSLWPQQQRKSRRTWDLAGREKASYKPHPVIGGAVTSTASLETRYDSAGRVVRTAAPLEVPGFSGHKILTATVYDNRGRPIRMVQGRGSSVDFTGLPGQLSLSDYTAATPQSSNPVTVTSVTTFTRYDNLDRATRVEGPDGAVTLTLYDFAGRVVRTVSPPAEVTWEDDTQGPDAGGQLPLQTTQRRMVTAILYNLAGNPVVEATGIALPADKSADQDAWTSAMNGIGSWMTPGAEYHTVTNTWDRMGRLRSTERYKGGDSSTESFTYNEAGHRLTVRDGAGKLTRFTYDPLGRVLSTDYAAAEHDPADPAPTPTEAAINLYDAVNLIRATAPDGRYKEYFYDEADRIRTINHDAGSSGATADVQISQQWNAAGELLAVSFAGQAWRNSVYGYDARGRRISEMSLEKTHKYTYDLRDRLIRTVTDEAGADDQQTVDDVTVETVYDTLGRVRTITEKRPVNGSVPATSATTSYGYDLAGRLRMKVLPPGTQKALSEWKTYDQAGRTRSQLTYSRPAAGGSGENLSLLLSKWDALGNLLQHEEIRSALPGLPSSSRMIRNSYNGLSRLVRETVRVPSGGAPAEICTYGYDGAGNRLLKSTTLNSTTHTQESGYNFTLAGHAPGSVLVPLAGESTEGRANQILTLSDTQSGEFLHYRYDRNGNRSRAIRLGPVPAGGGERPVLDVTTYKWDQSNRLATVTIANAAGAVTHTWTFGYDHRSRRILRQAPGMTGVELDSYAGGTALTRWSAGAVTDAPAERTRLASFIRGSDMGGGVGGLLYTVTADVTQRFLVEYGARGDVIGEINHAGEVAFRALYRAFGDYVTGYGSTTPALRHRASTKEEESALGLLNEGFRWRDIRTGAFLSRDPAGFIDGPNLYAYVSQNPWSAFDPEGLADERLIDGSGTARYLEMAEKLPMVTGYPMGGSRFPALLGSEATSEKLQGYFDQSALLWAASIADSQRRNGLPAAWIDTYNSAEGDTRKDVLAAISDRFAMVAMTRAGFVTNDKMKAAFESADLTGRIAMMHLPADIEGYASGSSIGVGKGQRVGNVKSVAASGRSTHIAANSGAETFYRTMSQAHYEQLLKTGQLPATAETFISPTRAFSANYDGVMVQFNMRAGTTSALESIGVRDASALTGQLHGGMPGVSKGWTSTNAFFKAEGTQINIGLGKGAGLDTFNGNILNFQAIPK